MKNLYLPIAILFVCLVSFLYGRHEGIKQAKVIIQNDTIVRVDTIRIDRPVEKYTIVEKPVYFPLIDTLLVTIHDTTYIALKKEIKGYSGGDYKLEISGVSPSLDWIEVYPKTITIDHTIEKKWGIGITGGLGVVYNGQFHAGVGLMVGVNYKF